MKISNETKVGILTIVALTLLILGFNFLKGKDVFNKSKKIYAVFSDLGPLSKSNEVKINGYVIGKVYELQALDKDISGIVATINLTEDVNIPANSMAYISSPLVGASFIAIERGDSSYNLQPGDTLRTRPDNGILDDVKAQLNPTLNKLKGTLDSLNTVFTNINEVLSSETKGNLREILTNLNKASLSLNGLLGNNSDLAKTMANANEITSNLRKNNDSITYIISNAKLFSDRLAALELKQTMDSLQNAIGMIKTTIAKFSDPNGSLGALLKDRKLYDQLNRAMLSAEVLIDDVRIHPKRYVNLSIFGKKDKTGPITSPEPKDTLRIGQ
jgi:phospholipid/cholesterol/gamma-HCH transport system substrate-binding protein